jgi:hypothetical protein
MTTKYTDQYVLIDQVDYDLGPSLDGFSDDAINAKELIKGHQVCRICVYVMLLDQFLAKHCNQQRTGNIHALSYLLYCLFSSEKVVHLSKQ